VVLQFPIPVAGRPVQYAAVVVVSVVDYMDTNLHILFAIFVSRGALASVSCYNASVRPAASIANFRAFGVPLVFRCDFALLGSEPDLGRGGFARLLACSA
jgi:hypothetical protein